MDDLVLQAMAKWPRVPACYGWLGLDARGDWYMRDDRTQALGTFTSGVPGAKGSRLTHDKLLAFIHRNYAADDSGCWFFQNGPQRVFVELEAAPLIARLQPDGQILAHTGTPVQPIAPARTDTLGRLYVPTQLGLALVHTQDMWLASERIAQGQLRLDEETEPMRPSEAEVSYQFVSSPAQRVQRG
jgi:hypothetical protein